MISEVYEAFLEEYQLQQITGFCTQEIDGYSGFVFTSSGGTVTIPSEVNRAIHNITADYNLNSIESRSCTLGVVTVFLMFLLKNK